jgi:uncharacterized alpha-E superfamily protein
MMAFYGIPMKHLKRKRFYLFEAGKISNFLSLISVIQTLFCFRRSEEVEQLLLESVLENHNLLAQYRSNYKSQFNYSPKYVVFRENSPYTLAYIFDTLSYNISNLQKIRNQPVEYC